jgi:hypothetical protein
VAKWVVTNGPPNFNDVVFAFVNLDTTNGHQGVFNLNLGSNGTNLFGIISNRLYNVRNLAAYTAVDPNRRNVWLWNGGSNGIAGSNLLTQGVTVSLNPVPSTSLGWTNAPFEAQYLKLYDVTPPPITSTPGIGTTNNYVLGQVVTFSWPSVLDALGGISGYYVTVGTTPGGTNLFSGVVAATSVTVTNSFGSVLYASVSAINNAGIVGPASASSAGIALIDPAWIPVVSIQAGAVLDWNSVSGRVYQVWSSTNLPGIFAPVGNLMTASTPALVFTNAATNTAAFFRVQMLP